jgi:hypothetical protein
LYFTGFGIYWTTNTSNQIYVNAAIRATSEGITYYPTPVTIGRWYHITWVYSSSSLSNLNHLYINGTYVNNGSGQTGTYSSGLNGRYITIGGVEIEGGANNFASRLPFPGSIGQCLIYNRPLSVSEIQQNFNEVRYRYNI